MRAIPDVVDPCALRGQLRAHPVEQRIEFAFGKMTMRHAGLVGEEEHQIAGIVEPANGFGGVRHPADLVVAADMAVVVIDDAVAVEEGGGLVRRADRRDGIHLG